MAGEALSVLFVNSTRKWGGVKTWTLDFGQALRERGHAIAAVVRPDTPFAEACRRKGFTVHPLRFGAKYNPLAVLRLLAVLRRERPDVVVVNISKDLNVGAVAAKLRGLPVLHRVGLVEDFKGSREERWQHRVLVERVLVPSEYLRDGLLARFPWMSPDAVRVVPNSKRLDPFPLPKERDSGPVTFGVSSQLSPSKGHTYLLQALELLGERGFRPRLRIAGTGSLEKPLREEVGRRGLAGEVEFAGFQRDMPAFLAGLDAYVLPSLNESFSNAILEAMACGLPVIAYRAGGVPEVVGDAGILVPPRSVAELAEAMAGLAEDPERRASLGRRARERVRERFDLDRNVVVLEALLREMAGSCGARG